MKQPARVSPDNDALNLAVIDFVRSIRNDPGIETLMRVLLDGGLPAGINYTVAEAYGIDAKSLLDRTGQLIAGHHPAEPANPPKM